MKVKQTGKRKVFTCAAAAANALSMLPEERAWLKDPAALATLAAASPPAPPYRPDSRKADVAADGDDERQGDDEEMAAAAETADTGADAEEDTPPVAERMRALFRDCSDILRPNLVRYSQQARLPAVRCPASWLPVGCHASRPHNFCMHSWQRRRRRTDVAGHLFRHVHPEGMSSMPRAEAGADGGGPAPGGGLGSRSRARGAPCAGAEPPGSAPWELAC